MTVGKKQSIGRQNRIQLPSLIMRFFEYKHLPEHLQDTSRAIWATADKMDQELIAGPEKDAGLRKLLEAKDCFVRAALK